MSATSTEPNQYYERKTNGLFELCQTRFRHQPNHPHSVCAVSPDHEGLVSMYEKHLTGGVDWLQERKDD